MSIRVERLVKSYDDHVVVHQVSLDIADGECFVLLGPSGCGKSTVLRIIAGLTQADGGRVLLHGRDVSRLPPQRRGVGMVFQQYALFGHMTVADNVEFALRVRRQGARDRARRRDELLELVGLTGFQRRMPHQLSGGQQQRVALARALAHRPEVLLLDEPFGALDARIRSELRRTLRRIQREIGVTTIFVTHDQEEAFELADRMAVMNFGRLLEVGVPGELYLRPQTEFVATFLGRANLFVGRSTSSELRLGDARFPLHSTGEPGEGSRRVQVLFRPEDVAVKLSREALDWPVLGEGIVEEAEFSGASERLRIRIPTLPGVRPISPAVPFGVGHMLLESTRSQHLARKYPLRVGQRAWVGVRRVHALAHRGLSFAVIDRGPAVDPAVLELGGTLGRLCHARLLLLTPGHPGPSGDDRAASARERLGGGLVSLEVRRIAEEDRDGWVRELEMRPTDVVVVDRAILSEPQEFERLLHAPAHHLLLVPASWRRPARVLVSAAPGEPGKHVVVTAGRLLRHLGAAVTLMTVSGAGDAVGDEPVARFHAAATRTLSACGLEAVSRVRSGSLSQAIADEIEEGAGQDLLVIGSPAPEGGGTLLGALSKLLKRVRVPVLIVTAVQEEA